MEINLKRIYEAPAKAERLRVLVDRVWPRGVSKDRARIDLWLKEIAPSTELRKWFNHDPRKWEEFKRRYSEELDAKTNAVRELLQSAHKHRVTLIYSAKDTEHNQALALKEYIEKRR